MYLIYIATVILFIILLLLSEMNIELCYKLRPYLWLGILIGINLILYIHNINKGYSMFDFYLPLK